MRQAVLIAAVAVFLTASSAFAGPVEYYYTDLGPGKARAINSNGEVVGSIGLWFDGQVIELGFDAYDISDTGIVVGVDESNSQPCKWQEGVKTYLPLSEGATYGHAYGVNDAGEVVGQADGLPAHWSDSGLSILQYPTWGGSAYDINNHGLIVGGMGTVQADMHAVTWSGGSFTDLDPLNLMGQHHAAFAVNEDGVVIGNGEVFLGEGRWDSVAYNWKDDAMLPGSDSVAYGVNILGAVVGKSGSAAVLWQDGQRHILQDLLETWQQMGTYSVAEDINDSGQIVGWYNDGSDHAFLLTPVPEPATLSILLVGTALLPRRRGNRKRRGSR